MQTKEQWTLLEDSITAKAVDYLYVASDHVEQRKEEVVEMNPVKNCQVDSVHVCVFHPEGQVERQALQIHVQQLEWLNWNLEVSYECVEGEAKTSNEENITYYETFLKESSSHLKQKAVIIYKSFFSECF